MHTKKAQEFSRRLYAEGVYAVGFFYPVVPQEQARIRTQLSVTLSFDMLDEPFAAFHKIKQGL